MEKEKKAKGLKIKTVNYILILVACITYVFLLYETVQLTNKYQDLIESTDAYIMCEKAAIMENKGSDILTEEVRLFVVTGEIEHADAYFKEANETKNREHALKILEQYHNHDRVYEYLEEALKNSNELMEREIYAMRLTAEAKQLDMNSLPEQIREVTLDAQDAALSENEKENLAMDMVFGTAYKDKKQLIVNNISYGTDYILNSVKNAQEQSQTGLYDSMKHQKLAITLLFCMNIALFFVVTLLIVKPLQVYIKCISENRMLEIIGSYEFKYLALTYNDIYELNATNETMLRKQAEYDVVTGILNRSAFEQLKEGLKSFQMPMALLLIDVDLFKEVNDTYGHEIGDKVLRKVAQMLYASFRSSDFVARIGGDEFAVIMTDVTSKQKDVILNKVQTVNDHLGRGQDGLPKVSLSVGVAFSSEGFDQNLYKNADRALYQVKEQGRCGCSFYN
ncbi:MAG: GGDEF domain-containing protein [Eubacteriales bacterium]|nr:GGDEF domain-containing protein [Eubacteriales bacterium]